MSGKYRIAEGSTEFDATPLTENDFYEGDGCLIAGNRLVVVSKTTAIVENGAVWEFPSTGLYAKNRPGLNRFASVTYESNTVYQIDEKFIPDTIARTAELTAPKTEFVLSSPNGTNFRITIDDSGKLIVSNMDGDVIEQSSGNLPDSEEAEF
jgi:hypothetical protein